VCLSDFAVWLRPLSKVARARAHTHTNTHTFISRCPCDAVGYSEEEAIQKLAGDLDVYVSKFRPMK